MRHPWLILQKIFDKPREIIDMHAGLLSDLSQGCSPGERRIVHGGRVDDFPERTSIVAAFDIARSRTGISYTNMEGPTIYLALYRRWRVLVACRQRTR